MEIFRAVATTLLMGEDENDDEEEDAIERINYDQLHKLYNDLCICVLHEMIECFMRERSKDLQNLLDCNIHTLYVLHKPKPMYCKCGYVYGHIKKPRVIGQNQWEQLYGVDLKSKCGYSARGDLELENFDVTMCSLLIINLNMKELKSIKKIDRNNVEQAVVNLRGGRNDIIHQYSTKKKVKEVDFQLYWKRGTEALQSVSKSISREFAMKMRKKCRFIKSKGTMQRIKSSYLAALILHLLRTCLLFIGFLMIITHTSRNSNELEKGERSIDCGAFTGHIDETSRIILVMGERHGHTANWLVGEERFESGSLKRIRRASYVATIIEETKFVIVTLPDIVNVDMSSKEIDKEIAKCNGLTALGVHRILYVVETRPSTHCHFKTLQRITSQYGERALDYISVVFTGKEEVIKAKETMNSYVKSLDRSSHVVNLPSITKGKYYVHGESTERKNIIQDITYNSANALPVRWGPGEKEEQKGPFVMEESNDTDDTEKASDYINGIKIGIQYTPLS